MTKDEALKLALEALEPDWELAEWYVDELQEKAIIAIREALAQPEHSCVACEGNPKGSNNPCSVCGLAQPEQEPEHEWVRGECVKCGQSIEQPEQEPVVYRPRLERVKGNDFEEWRKNISPELYAAGDAVLCWVNEGDLYMPTPPQRKPLTDEEIEKIWWETKPYFDKHDFTRAIEAAHGIKGGA